MHLDTLTRLSHTFGTPEFVIGGGGNTSGKTAETLWVKPSGTTLSGLTPEAFVRMRRADIERLFSLRMPSDPDAREARVMAAMSEAREKGQTGRPSVEAPLHHLLEATYVVHTHPASVNGLCAARDGAVAAARLLPEALWIPYIDPGYTLCMDVRRRVHAFAERHGRQPEVLLLQNHGIFVAGNDAETIERLYRHVLETLRQAYSQADVTAATPAADTENTDKVSATRHRIEALLGNVPDGACRYGGRFEVAAGPISPDHIVYARAFPCTGELSTEKLNAFRERHGYNPTVFATEAGVFAVGASPKHADIALAMARDGARVQQLAEAFGGVRFMNDRDRAFIEHWEVESYRQKQVAT